MHFQFRRLAGLSVLLLLLTANSLTAQVALYAQYKGEGRLVRQVHHLTPFVDDGAGKLVAAESRYLMNSVPEYAPVYIAIRNLKVMSRSMEMMGSGAELNKRFEFKGDFESAYPLEDVFVVLELQTEDAGKLLYVQEIGNLTPRHLKPIEMSVPLTQRIGPGRFKLHLFTRGMEVFHSEMPFGQIERSLDKQVRRRLEGVTDAEPKPYVGPTPEYPPKLKRAKTAGRAVIRLTIGATGRVQDPIIKEATDPAFGESALAAARMWRFLPRVKEGRATPATIDMPFVFNP
ncbi:energy transducer TonB [Opitutus sp. ER46]|uniref:energy transducer TonB n=1 Tax=Opitutus sp. ER46 TaxID=2161864 RepID=UPI000D309A82|nr:energy transducer TonB [Opitutus sp. ER46]PTX91351.1 hypothetical protein DB354_15755 [Opitutus sp. ER46]